MSLGNDIDETGDPPRVWNNTLEIPGCAFTRSIGDAIAEKIGVNAVPEIVRWKLESNDKFIVIASDGVFEFLTSQNVVDIIAQYDDIVKAAKFVVEEAYRLWLMYDDRLSKNFSFMLLAFTSCCPLCIELTTYQSSSFLSKISSGKLFASYRRSLYTLTLLTTRRIKTQQLLSY